MRSFAIVTLSLTRSVAIWILCYDSNPKKESSLTTGC